MTVFRGIDFETTGIPKPLMGDQNPQRHGVLEVGWCDLVNEKLVLDPIGYLTNPNRDCDIEALATHHIMPRDVAGAPSPDRIFLKLTADRPALWFAHNADFEQIFFTGGETPWVCTFKGALRVWPEAPGHSLQVLRYYLGLDDEPDFVRELAARPHRAPDDAYVSAFVLRRLLAKTTLDSLQRWAKGPALLSRMTFGKHYGEFWKDVAVTDRKYLRWIVDDSDFDDRNVLATARYWLKQTSTETTGGLKS